MSCRHSSSVVLALFLCAVLADAQWVVNTTQGAYRATCDNNACVFKGCVLLPFCLVFPHLHHDTAVYLYAGIRYAKSTEGAMRWTRAVPPDAHSSIVDADNYPPICPQRVCSIPSSMAVDVDLRSRVRHLGHCPSLKIRQQAKIACS